MTTQTPTQAIGPTVASDAEEREIAVVQIEPEDNARTYFDLEQLQALADSIATHGLLNAITVYCHTASGRFRLIAGERRWRAVQMLGWTTIGTRVLKEPPDRAKRRELALIENEQRQDLSDIERGIAYLDFMTSTGCTASALAKKLGKHVSTVTRTIARIRKLPEDLREIVGLQLPPSVAQLLTSLPSDEEKRRFAGLYIEGKIKSGDELAAAIKAARNGQATGGTAGFTCEESGVKIAVTLTSGGAEGQALGHVENALRILLKDLAVQKHRGLTHWKTFLEKKAKAAKKAAEAAAAQNALASLAKPIPCTPPPAAK
ncbi:MAG TPA: ParB/RepB/Spo0J family partition protein [Gemmataceae bacterium]|nr:ParB/RepB/Spo0J family partition protein [Gemmataceae bacterium]